MSELRPCPFCGVVPTISGDPDSEEYVRGYCLGFVGCFNEQCTMPQDVVIEPTQKEATAKWNTRPIEDALTARIAELEAERRWIPVSERLPDNWESVLTIDISKSTRDMVTAFYNPETSLWSTHFSCDLWVTHWMPLPEPPIVYGKVCEE